MYAEISNENYGYAVATFGPYVAVGNPSLGTYDATTASFYRTGSIDIYKYDPTIDEHRHVSSLYAPFDYFTILLAAESGSSTYRTPLHTEDSGSVLTRDHNLELFSANYTTMHEDDYGMAVDIYNKLLVVGNPWWKSFTSTYGYTASVSGSSVDLFDLTAFDKDVYNSPNFNEQTKSYITSLLNPELPCTSSFGYSVSVNNEWLAVGSPFYSGSNGVVYLYRNPSGDRRSWQYFQKITPPVSASLSLTPAYGYDVKLAKETGSGGWKLLIGTGDPSASVALLYEYSSSAWRYRHAFRPDHTTLPLTFGQYTASSPVNNSADGFGMAVSLHGTTAIVGAPYDRAVYEYSGSTQYQQGAGYIFERCEGTAVNYKQVVKTNGYEKTLKRHRLGYSVDIYENNAAFGLPKTNIRSMTSCFIGGTISQLHFCDGDLENSLQGQVLTYQKVSGSWKVVNAFRKRKKYLSPYRGFGGAVAIADLSMVVGAPMMFTDMNRIVNYDVTPPDNYEFDDVSGKAYIYNLKNLHEEFNVGNVFYRNGKVVLMTSGSVFDGLLYNPINTGTYEYELDFKGQRTIYEKQVICTVEPGEFNVSTNPTALIKVIPRLDINKNGVFDFQDADIILRYMQYLNTRDLDEETSTDWSSSIVIEEDEQSFLRWCQDNNPNSGQTDALVTESFNRFEFIETDMATILDLNQDSRVDFRDMNIMWKYFSNRLTQQNYSTFIIPSCRRKLFSDIIDYMDTLTLKNSRPQIKTDFLDYERLSMSDKTGSYLAPYVSSIGLYNGLELVALAKLGTPIKVTSELPINFVVKMDF
jgi:hypothetical protein